MISNGQVANETTFNTGFVSRTEDTSTVGKVDLLNADAESGDAVENVQKEINGGNAFTGRQSGVAADSTPEWDNNDVGSSADNLQDRAEAITQKFNEVSGHTHSGAAGDGGPIDATTLTAVRLKGSFVRGVNIASVTGSSYDVSSVMTMKTPSTGDDVKGVCVSANLNRCLVRDNTTATKGDGLTDALGNAVYAELTYLASVWTLSFYVDIGATKTAYALTAQAVAWYYQELFNPLLDAPIYSTDALVPSDNATQDVVDASSTQRGLVNTGAQVFSGLKQFVNGLFLQAYLALSRGDTASTASIAQLSSAKSFRKITGSTLTDIHGIAAGVDGQVITVYNGTSVDVTMKHASGTATAVDRLVLPGAVDAVVPAGSSSSFIYDTGQSRWVVYSGGGAAGANKTLSNLDTPTAVNCDIKPGAPNVYDLGEAYGLPWHEVISKYLTAVDTVTSKLLTIGYLLTPSGSFKMGLSTGSLGNPISLFTQDNAVANSTATGDIEIASGNKTAGTGDSGNISHKTGTSAGGLRGDITSDARRVKNITTLGTQHTQIATPGTNAASGTNVIYPKSDGKWYSLDSAGVETLIGGAGLTVIAAAGTITGTYQGDVLCLGAVSLAGNVTIEGNLISLGAITRSGAFSLTVNGNAFVTGAVTLTGTASGGVGGAGGALTVDGNLRATSTINLSGANGTSGAGGVGGALTVGGVLNGTSVTASGGTSSSAGGGNGGAVTLSGPVRLSSNLNTNGGTGATSGGTGGAVSISAAYAIGGVISSTGGGSGSSAAGNGGALVLTAPGVVGSTLAVQGGSSTGAGNAGNGGSVVSTGNLSCQTIFSPGGDSSGAGNAGNGGNMNLSTVAAAGVSSFGGSASGTGDAGNGGFVGFNGPVSAQSLTTRGGDAVAGNKGNGGSVTFYHLSTIYAGGIDMSGGDHTDLVTDTYSGGDVGTLNVVNGLNVIGDILLNSGSNASPFGDAGNANNGVNPQALHYLRNLKCTGVLSCYDGTVVGGIGTQPGAAYLSGDCSVAKLRATTSFSWCAQTGEMTRLTMYQAVDGGDVDKLWDVLGGTSTALPLAPHALFIFEIASGVESWKKCVGVTA